ncbi:MAG: homoserine O-succinyltransferase [Lachnospiraceae bacterium]|nr:homoserine O-succinyltransferase [Lachnospiraceae bacterium]MBO7096035.1 homoserine O-succinyltransferase [Lachnospiraceae bacterium]MBP5762375.1 homoserine O-succinyltransferase [Lachnospiraceae bacterium]
MPIKVQSELPARQILETENIFVMDENRAMHQDIRPLKVLILNNMPVKQDTELQLLRALSNTPLQVDVTFMMTETHVSKNTSASHLNKFYVTFEEIKDQNFDGMIITGAPVEDISFEEVDYWDETVKILDWADKHVTSIFHICWGAQAGFYHYYGIDKRRLPEKLFGVFEHRVLNRKIPLVRGFDDVFLAPHSRHTDTPSEALKACKDLTILAESDKAGVYLAMAENGHKIFVTGHSEYDRLTLKNEYERDLGKRDDVSLPVNYFPNDDPNERPLLTWRSHSNNLYSNWLNYYVYQATPYDVTTIGSERS